MSDSNLILEVKGLNKWFGATYANKNIDFQLRPGEVRGLAGENGSGKSTLLTQIAGIQPSDSGEMFLNGTPYKPRSPLDATSSGVAIVVQELGLVPNLPAGINVFLGNTKRFSRFGIINNRKVYEAANQALSQWGLPPIPFQRLSGDMNVESRKMVELARALASDPQILILDELTQSLSHDNRTVLYELIRKFKEMGRSIILISHDLEEMLKITDSVSILRDGELLATERSQDIPLEELKIRMVGRKIEGDYYRSDTTPQFEDQVALSLRDVCTDHLKHVSFDLHKGEIFGLCGLSDSGIREVGQAAYGLLPVDSGEVSLPTHNVSIGNPYQALQNRVAYVPKDRDGEALMMGASIQNNFCLPSVETLKGRFGFLSPKKLYQASSKAREQFSVKSTGVDQLMRALSGGNKQKVNLGRWLIKDLDVLIVDCPTRGVDIGVKAYIYQCLREAKEKGMAILLITDELSEVLGMADTIAVMKDGEICKLLPRSAELSEEIQHQYAYSHSVLPHPVLRIPHRHPRHPGHSPEYFQHCEPGFSRYHRWYRRALCHRHGQYGSIRRRQCRPLCHSGRHGCLPPWHLGHFPRGHRHRHAGGRAQRPVELPVQDALLYDDFGYAHRPAGPAELFPGLQPDLRPHRTYLVQHRPRQAGHRGGAGRHLLLCI